MAKNRFIDKKWLNSHLKKIKQKAGSRYTPELNVDLPIAEIFHGLSRTKNFYTSARRHLGKLNREFGRISSNYDDKEVQKLYNNLRKETSSLVKLVGKIKEYDTTAIPWKSINKRTQKAKKLSWRFSDKLTEEEVKAEQQKTESRQSGTLSASEKFGSDIHYLYQTRKEFQYFEEFSSSIKAQLSNNPFLLLTGLAGTGKTHLLCDVVEGRIIGKTPLPCVLLFGESFATNGDPWGQIINQLSLKLNKNSFLRLLDKAGKQSCSRVLLIIDALNETRQHNFWKRNLNHIINEVKKYPNIALVVSIRSGFEEEVFAKKQRRVFVHEEHRGFQFREWEAVTKFFKEFNLPFPEIPILMPEFQNPLFLLLFCKAFQGRSKKSHGKKQKQIFRGHEGATYIFENFVKSVADRIATQFNLPQGRNRQGDYVIWDTVIEKVAAEMIDQSDDRISEDKLIDITKTAYPSIDHSNFIKGLERNLLLVKVPRYSRDENKYKGFDYRFPFQKFSDHLIGRYLFKKYEKEFGKHNKNLVTAKKFFSKRRKLGKFLSNTWNRGVVEALSIQCPEHLKGYELVEVAPYLKDSYVAQEAFVESLIWRKPDAFSTNLKNTLDYINTYIIRTQSSYNSLLNAFLAVAPIPNHPFNADFLHKHLSKFSMAKRDSWWSTFLHYQHGERGAVDRLVEWGWSEQDKSHINDESLRLCSVALSWFLTTSNRFLRDKSTKALVALLTNRLNVIIELLKQFQSVNDPYILERLYAAAYGCALRSRNNKTDLDNLAMWVYETNFKNGNPPTHILMRDYARGIIEVAIYQKSKLRIDRKKIEPPFNSKWPKRIPSEKTLKSKYYPEDFFKDKTKDRGFLDIWSSVMYNFGSMGDFGNYVLNSAINHWSGRRLKGKEVNRKLLFEKFKGKLTNKQKVLLEKATNPFFGVNLTKLLKSIRIVNSNEGNKLDDNELKRREIKQKKEMKKAFAEFEDSLSRKKIRFFNREIKPFLDDRGVINDPIEQFDTGLAQRWVFNRVVQLGWDPKLHGEFDRYVNYNRADRSEHKPERIGKKYQWIALHKLLANISDNFEFKEESWSDEIGKYEGPWQLSVRDIDPSCTLKEYPNLKSVDIPNFDEYQKSIDYNAWGKKTSHSTWLKTTRDLPDSKQIIEPVDNKGNHWLVLEGFVEWQKETPPEQEKYNLPTRRLWYMLKSYLVRKQDAKKVFDWAKEQNFWGKWMPESHEFYNIFLGEFPWAPASLYHYIPYYHHNDWTDTVRNKKIPAKVLVADDEYLSSGSSIDCSTNESIRVKLPAKWIVDKLRLKMKRMDGRFFDSNDNLVVFDPSVFDDKIPRFLLIRKDTLYAFLHKKGYSIFWTLLGEKGMIGGGVIGQPLGSLVVNGAYTLNDKNQIIGGKRSRFKNARS